MKYYRHGDIYSLQLRCRKSLDAELVKKYSFGLNIIRRVLFYVQVPNAGISLACGNIMIGWLQVCNLTNVSNMSLICQLPVNCPVGPQIRADPCAEWPAIAKVNELI